MVMREPAARRSSRAGLAALGMLGLLTAAAWGEAPAPPAAPEPAPEVIQLTRVAYKLKPATSEAVAALLKDNVKSVVLETKTEGDTFTVTTTPDAQEAVGQFIALLQGKPLAARGPYWGPGGSYYPGPGGTSGPGPGGTFGPRPGGTPPPGATSPPPGR